MVLQDIDLLLQKKRLLKQLNTKDSVALIREVLLKQGDKPLIYAQTIIPESTIVGTESRLAELGTQSLGQVLFQSKETQRGHIEVSTVSDSSALGSFIKNKLGQALTDVCFIRRSTFNLNNKKFTLVIKKIFTPVNNGRFQVDMEFENEVPNGIRRGQNLQVKVALSAEKQAVLIPLGGFFQKTGGNWIFKISEDGKTAYKVDIRLGSQNTKYYEVIEGLNVGDKVITSSYDSYNEIEQIIIK